MVDIAKRNMVEMVYRHIKQEMKERWSEISWNEEIRRCMVVDITEGEGSKAEMVWTHNKKR